MKMDVVLIVALAGMLIALKPGILHKAAAFVRLDTVRERGI
jgi:hypothetical protein